VVIVTGASSGPGAVFARAPAEAGVALGARRAQRLAETVAAVLEVGWMAQACGRVMRAGNPIVNVSSGSG
jgi:NADP-dependent 3-hydroxy acid dehydrogenase YdfG